MATLYWTTGFQEEVKPPNGTAFTLEEMQTLVGGFIEIVPTIGHGLMVIDEEGKLKGKALNHVATTHYLYGSHDPVVGVALIGTPKELGQNADEEVEDKEGGKSA